MKLLIEIDSPGIEHFHIHEPAVPTEVGAFVARLVRARTRGPEPRVHVLVLSDDQVAVDVNELLRLHQKAGAK